MKALEVWEISIKDQWAAGTFQLPSPQETAVANAQALGEVRILKEIREIDEDKLYEVLIDDE